MHRHIDPALISTFIVRWQPNTNNFSHAMGDMTIMLNDVKCILGLGITDDLFSVKPT